MLSVVYLWLWRFATPSTDSRAFLFRRLCTCIDRFCGAFPAGAIVHRRITPFTARLALFGTLCRRSFGLGARSSTSPHGVGRSVFDHELTSVKLVILGMYQGGGCVLCVREVDECEPEGLCESAGLLDI